MYEYTTKIEIASINNRNEREDHQGVFTEMLNDMASQGWRLHSVSSIPDRFLFFAFEREKKGKS